MIAGLLGCLPAAASNLVTGNGLGFAVAAPYSGTMTKFYAHPKVECPAISVPVKLRQTGMEGALNGARKEAHA